MVYLLKNNRKNIINSDSEILNKLKESENNYKKNWISYSFEESYEKWINFINNLVSKKNV